MPSYELIYRHPYFMQHVDDDYSLHSIERRLTLDLADEESVIAVANEFVQKPTGEKYYRTTGAEPEELMNLPIKLARIVRVWSSQE